MQVARAGMATAVVSVPLRYMHTPNEVLHIDDLENTAKLLAAFLEAVTPEMDWIP
jgi:endoglucanase